MPYFATGFVKEWDVDAMGTYRLTEAESRLMNECDELWMGRRFWNGATDAGAVEAAVAFAYMMADRPAPASIRWADGPAAASRIADAGSAAHLWQGLLAGPHYIRSPEFHLGYTKRMEREYAADLAWSLRRHRDPGAKIAARMAVPFTSPASLTLPDVLGEGAFGDFLCAASFLPEAGAWAPIRGLFEACGFWWWAGEDTFVVSRPPVRLLLDESGELHAESGPAIVYADGTEVFAHHGTGAEAAGA